MKRLRQMLKLLQDVDFVTRPLESYPEEAVGPEQMDAMQDFPTMQPKAPPTNVPLKPNAFDGLENIMNLDTKGNLTPPTEPDAATESPARKKLKYLETMNQARKMRPTPFKPMNTLAGGEGGTGIY